MISLTPEEVAPSLKQRFSSWIDARTAKGVKTYGTPLMTFNGRVGDAIEELLDFCQYQEQDLMEAEALLLRWLSEGGPESRQLALAIDTWLGKRDLSQ